MSNLTNKDLDAINRKLTYKLEYVPFKHITQEPVQDLSIAVDNETLRTTDSIDISNVYNCCIIDIPLYIGDDNLTLNIKGADYIYYTKDSIKLETPLTKLKYYRLHMIISTTIDDGEYERTVIIDLQELIEKP